MQNWNYDKQNLDDYLQRFGISSSAIYPFSHKGKLCFLRIIPVVEKNIKSIQAELQLLDFLQSKAFPALRVVPDKKGDKLLIADTKWGKYYASVFAGVEGVALDRVKLNTRILEDISQDIY